ncbi:MAG: hypothetical protein LBI28_09950 [Treponema sp.]|jgi:uncharacterized protein YceK|nr:hypothetical protein [Treponema sp.]
MKNLFLSLFVCVFLCGCATAKSSSTISPNVDFSKYSFAAIGSDISGGSSAFDAQIEIQNALVSFGYTVIGDNRIGTLSAEDQAKTFIVTAGMSSSSQLYITQYGGGTTDYTYCTINIADYLSGYILASFRGSHGGDYSYPIEAVRAAILEMEKILKK